MPSAAMEEYRAREDLEDDLDFRPELSPRLQELRNEWRAGLDAALAERDSQALKGPEKAPERTLEGHNERREAAAPLGYGDPTPPEEYNRERSREHNGQMVSCAIQAMNGLEFQDPAERRELALIAAQEMMQELVNAPADPSPEERQIHAWAEAALANKFKAFHPEGYDVSGQIHHLLLRALQDESIDQTRFVNGFRSDFYSMELATPEDWAKAALVKERPAEDYPPESTLGGWGPQLRDWIKDLLRNDYGRDPWDPEKITSDSEEYERRLDHWMGVRAGFNLNEFLSPEHWRQEAALLANAAVDAAYPPESRAADSPAAIGIAYLRESLNAWLTRQDLTDHNAADHGDDLQDAAAAADFWATHRPDAELDLRTLTDIAMVSQKNVPEALTVLQAANDYRTALTAMGLASPQDLEFSPWRVDDPLHPRGSRPEGVSTAAEMACMDLIMNGNKDTRDCLRAAADVTEKESDSWPPQEKFRRAATERQELSDLIAEQIRESRARGSFPRPEQESPETLRGLMDQQEELQHPKLQERFADRLDQVLKQFSFDLERKEPEEVDFSEKRERIAVLRLLLDLDRRWRQQSQEAE